MKRTTIARTLPTALATAGLALALSACSTTSETKPTPPPPPPTGSEFEQPEVDRPDSGSAPVNTDISSQLRTVYFDFDRAEIRGDARPVLRANGEALRRASASVVIEGHTDERGSEEYNLALGESRAQSVKKYLTNLGVSSSTLSIVSYGETRPAVSGHTESAWAKNRRAEFRAR
jgi:peptidoglycan-associated lipoprotein